VRFSVQSGIICFLWFGCASKLLDVRVNQFAVVCIGLLASAGPRSYVPVRLLSVFRKYSRKSHHNCTVGLRTSLRATYTVEEVEMRVR
jgi:hypothetical protein